jgi:SHS2 domain-containing protein
MHSLVHNFLDELLFVFSTEFFVAGELRVLELEKEQNFRIKVVGVGEIFDLSKHSQGTEVKAITYGSMQVHERADNSEIFVVVDI